MMDLQTVEYRYDSKDAWTSSKRSARPGRGERTNKMSENGGETLYFNSMWLGTEDSYDFRMSKNIYLGGTRIATRLNMEKNPSTGYEAVNTYYYHRGCMCEQQTKSATSTDHLGSSNIVTTPDGEVFEHIDYTPYGETWIEKSDDDLDMLPYRFTAKELAPETGLYYYGARCLNPRTSRWISSDPSFQSYVLQPGQKINELPGRGGVYNHINLNLYHYAGNNPTKYTYPTGRFFIIDDFIFFSYRKSYRCQR